MTDEALTGGAPRLRCFDSHCHLTDRAFSEDCAEAIVRAREAGVDRIAVFGEDIETSRAALELAARDERLYAAAGLHPHHADRWSAETASSLRETAAGASGAGAGRLVAIGEIGLDFYYDNSPRDAQQRAFLEQAEIARELGLPVAIHCRDAYDLLIDLVERHDLGAVGGVVHCFSGDPQQAARLAGMGFFLGIAGTITFKNNRKGPEVLRAVPIDALVAETDAPYLAPVPRRGKRNEPAYVTHTVRRIAEILERDPEETAERLYANTQRLFRIENTR